MEFDETTFFKWDANGQLTDVIRPCSGDHRHHWWNESGQMVAFVDNEHCGYYGYNAEGERTYKLTGESLLDQHNAGEQNFQMYFNNAVLYVNPYMVVTPKGYTKHYYNGSQRIAARIGILDDLPDDIIDTSAVALERISNARAYMENTLDISEPQTMDTASVFADIDGGIYPELQWQCIDDDYQTLHVMAHCDSNILYPILTKDSSHLDRRISGIYFYHSDHLGSATWITDGQGLPVQFMHYMPYGELWYDQQASAYNERYKFTGKERDRESGYDFFGARYYSSAVLSWLSVDPLVDKYLWISPYAYCAWNPIKYVDPNGKWFETAWDVANVLMDAASLISNIKEGNVGGAIADGAGLILDAGAVVVPFVPAGAGTALKAYRTADKVVDVVQAGNKIDKTADFQKNMVRGIQNEKKVLNDMGLTKNTKKFDSETNAKKSINVIPDAIQDGMMYEVKDTKTLSNTKQIQGERNAAKMTGLDFKIVTGEKTHASKHIPQNEIIRRTDLGPQ